MTSTDALKKWMGTVASSAGRHLCNCFHEGVDLPCLWCASQNAEISSRHSTGHGAHLGELWLVRKGTSSEVTKLAKSSCPMSRIAFFINRLSGEERSSAWAASGGRRRSHLHEVSRYRPGSAVGICWSDLGGCQKC